jgi:hypothetical protein
MRSGRCGWVPSLINFGTRWRRRCCVAAQTLSTLAQNLLREPDNPKFHSFKPTNNVIKRDLVDTKGTLEYAVAVR